MFSIRYRSKLLAWFILYNGVIWDGILGFDTEWEAIDFLAKKYPAEAEELRRIHQWANIDKATY
jgi:hypothetical protein